MIVLGFDPGLATTGYGVVEYRQGVVYMKDLGTITTPAGLPLADRLCAIAQDVQSLLDTYRPQVCGVEELFFTKNVKTGIAVAHARGVLLSAIAMRGIGILELTPLEIKNQLTGDGRADKKQMAKMLALTFGWSTPPTQDDANDALAVALATAHLWSFSQL